tara:strand:+ start:21296 stop:21796 length:501 start_codon:yes stop_codon:yes gene_type:complete
MIRHSPYFSLFGASMLAAFALSGCGGGDGAGAANRESTYPASGVVLYNDQPVEGAIVIFECLTPGKPGATARTDAKGKFTLSTYKAGDGAIAAKFVASVAKVTVEGEDTSYADTESPNYGKEPPLSARGKIKHHIPEKYTKTDSSQLGAEITTAGNKEIRFELKDN